MQRPSYTLWASIFSAAAVYAAYIWIRTQHILRIKQPREFYDTTEFLDIASRPLTSAYFWATTRPPITPLFFRLLDADPSRIVTAQLWLSILSWGVLALVLALVIRTVWLKPIAFLLVLAFSLGQNVIIWDALILGDSMSLSFLALFMATGLWLAAKWEPYRLGMFLVSAVLLAFIRDTYAYFLLMVGAGTLIFLFFTRERMRVFAISASFLLLFLAVNTLSTYGMRWYMPFMMTMGLRILPNPEYVTYFEVRGMPISDELMERAGKPIQADNAAMYYDPDLQDFRQWAREHGRGEFMRFLWFFKNDTFQNPLRDIDQIFNPDIYYYAATGYRPILTDVRLNELLYPTRFGLLGSLIANVLALLLLYPALQHRQGLWAIPLMLILFSYPQAVLVWNADANDIARHSIYHVIMLRIGFWMLILFAADFILPRIKLQITNRNFTHA